MDIPHWLIGLLALAIIAAFARSVGEIRVEQRSGPGRGTRQAMLPAVTEAQPRGTMSEDQQELKRLLRARTSVRHQLDILATGRTHGGGPAADRLKTTLKEIDDRIAELGSDRA